MTQENSQHEGHIFLRLWVVAIIAYAVAAWMSDKIAGRQGRLFNLAKVEVVGSYANARGEFVNDWVIFIVITLLALIASVLWGIQTALHRVREAVQTQNELSKKMLDELESIHNRASRTAEILWDESAEGRRAADESRRGWLNQDS